MVCSLSSVRTKKGQGVRVAHCFRSFKMESYRRLRWKEEDVRENDAGRFPNMGQLET